MRAGHLVPAVFSKTEIGRQFLSSRRERMVLSAAFAFALNLLYAFYHGVLGVLHCSLWLMAMCAFYGIFAIMRLSAVLCGRKHRAAPSLATEYFVMKLSGILLAALSFVLLAIVFLSLSQDLAVKHDEIMMITIAAYTFLKITMTIRNAVRQRRDTAPLLEVLRGISSAEAAASLLTLQRSMLVSFGTTDHKTMSLMNSLTGAAVCLFVLAAGIAMIRKGVKKGAITYGNIETCKSK